MVISCCALNCRNRHGKGDKHITFHRFPMNNPALLTQWIWALGRKNWKPSIHSLICSVHFLDEDYRHGKGKKKKLRLNVVPSVFETPWGFNRRNIKQVLPQELVTVSITSPNEDESVPVHPAFRTLSSTTCSLVSAEHNYALSNSLNQSNDLKGTIDQEPTSTTLPATDDKGIQTTNFPSPRELLLRKKIKALQNKNYRVRRRMHNMRNAVKELKRKTLGDRELHEVLDENFSGLPIGTLLKNELANKGKKFGRRYSNEFKHFAITLYCYSRKAYRYVGKFITLPPKTMITKWVRVMYSVPVGGDAQHCLHGTCESEGNVASVPGNVCVEACEQDRLRRKFAAQLKEARSNAERKLDAEV